ncbi:MAG: cytoplasmic protein, partial [Candidatus Methanofastidiosa archaeon]|nr:cytoplasmic protein [Candidatus Methanofastidiosa archaeon]
MNKIAIVAYSGEINNFVDALETALEKVHKGEEVKLIIEGEATHCIKDILNSNSPYRFLYNEIKNSGIIDCIC